MQEYRRLPALESGSKLSNPDLNDIGSKNYTDIILRYGSLSTKYPQLNTNAKTIVAAINELYAHPGGSTVIPNPPVEDIESTTQPVVGYLYYVSIDGDIYQIPSGGGSETRTLTQAEYDELSYEEKMNGTYYYISDG